MREVYKSLVEEDSAEFSGFNLKYLSDWMIYFIILHYLAFLLGRKKFSDTENQEISRKIINEVRGQDSSIATTHIKGCQYSNTDCTISLYTSYCLYYRLHS